MNISKTSFLHTHLASLQGTPSGSTVAPVAPAPQAALHRTVDGECCSGSVIKKVCRINYIKSSSYGPWRSATAAALQVPPVQAAAMALTPPMERKEKVNTATPSVSGCNARRDVG